MSIKSKWARYKQTHNLAKDYYKIKRNRSVELLDFINRNRQLGTCLSIDSFYPAIENVTTSYEFETFADLFINGQFISAVTDINSDTKFDNIIAVGQNMLRYATYTQAVAVAMYLKGLLNSSGILIMCLPLKVMQYHRLKYNSTMLIKQLATECQFTVSDSVTDNINNYYLSMSNEF